MKNFKFSFKKIIYSVTLMCLALSLIGCGNSLTKWSSTSLPGYLRDRAESNKNIVKQYQALHALSDSQAKTIIKNIDNTVDKLLSDLDIDEDNGLYSDATLALISSSVSKYRLATNALGQHPNTIELTTDSGEPIVYTWSNDPNGDGDTSDKNYVSSVVTAPAVEKDSWYSTTKDNSAPLELSSFVISNYLHVFSYGKGLDGTNIEQPRSVTRDKSEISALELVSMEDSINDNIRCKIHVLKPTINTTDNTGSLDGVFAQIHTIINSSDADKEKIEKLNNYFQTLNINNEDIYYIPKDNEDYKMVKETKLDYGTDKLGVDMSIDQGDDFTNALYVRLKEFNQDTFNRIEELKNSSPDAYVILSDADSGWHAYLIEYPISVIDSFTDNGTSVDVSFKQSGLGVNLRTGKTIKYQQNDDGTFDYSKSKIIETNGVPYLTSDAAVNENAVGISSFVLKGYNQIPIYDVEGTEYLAWTGRIILRDYLELTFAPECVEGEDLVVFGRKIRLNMTEWKDGIKLNNTLTQKDLTFDKSADIAEFVDQSGNVIPGSSKLKITDFCDVAELQKDTYEDMKVLSLTPPNLDNDNKEATLVEGKLPDINNLEHVTTNGTIRPVAMFPSEDIGSSDYRDDVTVDSKQRFYCIATKYGIFDSSGLYSDWLNSTSTTASLSWWNAYLVSENFTYDVSNSRVSDYLIGNYKYSNEFDMGIILDLDTVAKIQEEYEQASITDTIRFINTIFIVAGWLLIIYGFILILAWVLDTTADLGIKLMEKLTFGHWVAVQYAEDLPRNPMDEITYLTASGLAIKCIIIMSAGIILLTVNVFDIVLVLIELFGGIAQGAEKILKGLT